MKSEDIRTIRKEEKQMRMLRISLLAIYSQIDPWWAIESWKLTHVNRELMKWKSVFKR
jgi:hypothetical protein